jgi:hypothetical protein
MKKEEKALEHAQKVWGIYFDDIDDDCNMSRGEITQKDYIAGYDDAISDTNYFNMVEVLKETLYTLEIADLELTENYKKIKELIEATEL